MPLWSMSFVPRTTANGVLFPSTYTARSAVTDGGDTTTVTVPFSCTVAVPCVYVKSIVIVALFASGVSNFSCRSIVSARSEEHTSELQSQFHLVCRLLLE